MASKYGVLSKIFFVALLMALPMSGFAQAMTDNQINLPFHRSQLWTASVPAMVVMTVARNFKTFATVFQFTLIIKVSFSFCDKVIVRFSGAETEPKRHSPLQASPQGEDVTENRRNRRFSEVWYGSQAFAPSG